MRQYWFRGKSKETGEWVEGYYACESNHSCFHSRCKHYIFRDEFMDWNLGGLCQYEIIPETVGQYTEMEDKNGRKIFEGDIVNCVTGDFDGSDKYVYNFEITDIADFEQMGFLNFCYEIEIIGNIHDNDVLNKEE